MKFKNIRSELNVNPPTCNKKDVPELSVKGSTTEDWSMGGPASNATQSRVQFLDGGLLLLVCVTQLACPNFGHPRANQHQRFQLADTTAPNSTAHQPAQRARRAPFGSVRVHDLHRSLKPACTVLFQYRDIWFQFPKIIVSSHGTRKLNVSHRESLQERYPLRSLRDREDTTMSDLEPIFQFLQQAQSLEKKNRIEAATKVRLRVLPITPSTLKHHMPVL